MCSTYMLTIHCLTVIHSKPFSPFLWVYCGHVSLNLCPRQQPTGLGIAVTCTLQALLVHWNLGGIFRAWPNNATFWKHLVTLFFLRFVSLLISAEVAWRHRSWNWIMIDQSPSDIAYVFSWFLQVHDLRCLDTSLLPNTDTWALSSWTPSAYI